MLLELYVHAASGEVSTVEELIGKSVTPAPVAVRWLNHMETLGLVTRRAHRTDSMLDFIDLTDKAKRALDRHLELAQNLRSKI